MKHKGREITKGQKREKCKKKKNHISDTHAKPNMMTIK